MKTPQSASKPQKGGGGLSTPTSGRIAKNKGTPASLKVKVLEKNAKLALLKGQDTIALNGKSPKTPKNANTPKTPKNANTPKTTNSPKKNGTITGSPKNAGKPNPGTKQVPTPAKQDVQGKKRKSSEATPNNAKAAQKKSKTTPETSPEVKLGLKIEKLLESPKANSEKGLTKKQKKKAKKGEQSPAASVAVPGGSPAGKGNKKNKRQKKREALLAAKSPVEGQGKKANEPKQTTPNTTQSPGNAGKKSRRQKKKEALLSAKGGSIAKTVGSSPGQGVAKNQPQTSPLPGKIGKKAKKQKKPISPTAVQNGTGAKAVPAPAGKNSKLQKKKLAKVEKLKQKNGPQENVETPQKKKKAKRQSLNDSINKLSTDVKGAGQTGAFPNPIHAVNAIKALIEDEKEKRTQKPGLLDESPPVMVSVDFYYPPKSVHVVRIPLPNPHLGGTPDVLYIAKDDKKHKNDPEESIDSHTQKFKSIGLTPMPEILPLRAIHKEYSQFEEKRKLINRFDAILIDSRMCFRINSLLPRKLLKKKAPIPVRMHFEGDQLKKEVTAALRKSPAILNDNTISTTVKIGTIDMKAKSLVENMAAVCAALSDEKLFPGGKPNVRNVSVKTPKSEKYPVYISLVKRSEIEPPKERPKKKKQTVVGEVSTAGVTVAVHPSGDIDIQSKDDDFSDSDEIELDSSPKKQKRDAASEESDDEGEDESDAGDSDEELDPAVVAKFKKANKANDDEEEDESDEEGSEIEKAEQEFLLELRKQQDSLEAAAKKPLKGAKEESDEEEDDEEEDLDDEDELDDEEDDLDDEEDESEDEESAEEEVIPKLVPAKVAQPQKGKGKPAQNGFQGKGKKPHPAQKGSPKAAQKGKPNAMQKGKRSIARK